MYGSDLDEHQNPPTAWLVPIMGTDPISCRSRFVVSLVKSEPATRLVVADDDVLLREGIASLFDRSGFDVVGQAGDEADLLALVRTTRPDVAIVDIRMP